MMAPLIINAHRRSSDAANDERKFEIYSSSGRGLIRKPASFSCHHKMAKATFSLAGLPRPCPERAISRSGKHDYRNPDSNYSDKIATTLRRNHGAVNADSFLLDEAIINHPKLTKEFLQQLQLFGLLPSTIDEDDDDVNDDDLRRTPSDESNFANRKPTRKNQTSIDDLTDEPDELATASNSTCNADSPMLTYKGGLRLVKPVHQPCGSDQIYPLLAAPALLYNRRSFRKRIRRWTIHAPMSPTRYHRSQKGLVYFRSSY